MSPETNLAQGLDRSEVESYIADRPPAELIMARSIVRRVVVVGPILLLVFGVTRGWEGLLAAVVGVVIVSGYYLLSGAMMSRLARISLGAYHAGALFGLLVRLGLIAGTMLAVITLFEIDRAALGTAVIATYMVLLLLEAATFGMNRRRSWTARG